MIHLNREDINHILEQQGASKEQMKGYRGWKVPTGTLGSTRRASSGNRAPLLIQGEERRLVLGPTLVRSGIALVPLRICKAVAVGILVQLFVTVDGKIIVGREEVVLDPRGNAPRQAIQQHPAATQT